MKDLDDLLTKQAPKPKRPLSANFIESVLQEMKPEKQSFWQSIASSLHISRLSRASVAAVLAIVFISGSVAAISLWPKPSVDQTTSKLTPSGNRIVGYDTQNCLYFADLDGRKPEFKNEKIYYEVRENSKLTDQQIQDGIRGLCEENVSNNAISAMIKQMPENLPGLFSTEAYTITAISDKSISLSMDPHYEATKSSLRPNTTFTGFAKNLMVYSQDIKTTYKDLSVGDTIKMIAQDTSGKSSEAPDRTGNDWQLVTDPYVALHHPEHITILGIVKMPALTGNPGTMLQAFGTDVVRLEPCDNSETGLCRAYEFSR